ncbi:hypothetical protein B9Z55_007030 [Caenorhabditis nigoni]|uniref:DUF38 domain-containing protein n=1 Tax=Caenorhabditis nigoni TaxID=1611254 RepID=A0A2G5V7Q3_9PELO|nr:hypothetical protein B9Z55_007030 [Caenorhabditis nigoni]
MVSHSIPMGYESLKTVLLHTDPNLRFEIAQRIPKIRLTEKAVPLRIGSLSFEKCTTTVNSQSYKLGVYRLCHTEDILNEFTFRNKCGGVSRDLDQYGFEVPSAFDPILNGDVSFRTRFADVHRRDTEETEQSFQFSLRGYEEALEKINQLESEGKTVEDFLAGPMNEDDQRIRRKLRIPKKQLQSGLNGCRSLLLPFHYKRNNLAPPYTCYIQLTIAQGNVTKIQRYEYNQKLYEAAKKLNEILFANRPVIIVNKFENRCSDVLRLPVAFKIFSKFVCGFNEQIFPISSIVDSSRTLAELRININHAFVLNFQHSFVKNAKKLSIFTHEGMIDQLVRALETMENQRIHIGFSQYDNPSANNFFQLMQGWLSTERNIGSMITFGLKTDQIGEEVLELVRTQNEITESTERCVTFLQSDATKVKISYSPCDKGMFYKFLLTVKIKKAKNSRKVK